jgi:hypothetical protein
VTGTISVHSGSYALLANPGASYHWTVVNSGSIINGGTGAVAALSLGDSFNTVASGVVTNHTGGLISSAGTSSYGVKIWGIGSVTNAAAATIKGAGGVSVVEGSATVVNYGVILGSATSASELNVGGHSGIYETYGGALYNGPSGVIKGAVGVDLGTYGAAATVTNAGTIIGLSGATSGGAIYSVYFQKFGPNELIVEPTAVFVGDIVTRGTQSQVTLAGTSAASLGGFGTSITNFTQLVFDNGSKWTVSGNSAGFNTFINISGFASTDTIEVTNFVATSSSVSTNEIVLNGSASSHATLHIAGLTTSSTNIHFTTDSADTFVTDVCFVVGTRITTPCGEVPVEQLTIGNLVQTHRGDAKPIVWIGKGKALVTRGRRNAANPVIVRRHAIADNVPNRDLHVTKGHGLYFDGVLIPAEFLVNHRSIVWDDQPREVEIYHIELATHDVLLANGTPAESYRDDGNRWLFRNANTGWSQLAKPSCATVQTGGSTVDVLWHTLLERSGLRLNLPTTGEADLHLIVDGQRVNGRLIGDGLYNFRLHNKPTCARVLSRAAAQDELGLARDPRVLGVALRQIVLWQGQHVKIVTASDALLCQGFHAFEPDNGFRWTDGDAALPASLFDGVTGSCELELHVGCTARYERKDSEAVRSGDHTPDHA